MRERRWGFTLVELLVVIGIIALLVAVLLPVLASAQKQARKTACRAQLHGIGQAIRMYLNENHDRYPPAPALPSVNPHGYKTLMAHLAPHMSGQDKAFRCPADELVYPVEATSYFYYVELGERRISETFFYKLAGNTAGVPVLWDADNFHGGKLPANWLFADGHVDQFVQSPH